MLETSLASLRAWRGSAVPGPAETLAGATVEAMSETVELTVRYEDAGDGWVTAQVLEVPGAISEGRGREEARANVIDALRTVLTPDGQLGGGGPVDSEPLKLIVSG